VRVTASESIATRLVVPGLAELAAKHPAIEVEVVVSTRTLNLSRREADIALRMVRPEQPNLVARRAGGVAFALYCAERYLAKRGRPKAPDLAGHDILQYGADLASLPEAIWIAKHARGARVSFESNTTFTMTAACVAGFGLATLPCMLGDPEPALVRLTPPLGAREIWLVTHRDLQKSARVRTVLDHLADTLRRNERALSGGA
jgi:DNA-binding transcriptional LysR family regulator